MIGIVENEGINLNLIAIGSCCSGYNEAGFTFFKGMLIGYKTIAYFVSRLTSPPTPLRRRGELDPDCSELFS